MYNVLLRLCSIITHQVTNKKIWVFSNFTSQKNFTQTGNYWCSSVAVADNNWRTVNPLVNSEMLSDHAKAECANLKLFVEPLNWSQSLRSLQTLQVAEEGRAV